MIINLENVGKHVNRDKLGSSRNMFPGMCLRIEYENAKRCECENFLKKFCEAMRMRKIFEIILRNDVKFCEFSHRAIFRMRIFAKCEFSQNAIFRMRIFAKCELLHNANFRMRVFRKMRTCAKFENLGLENKRDR